jgi:Ca-activated chloride channel family protein
MAFYKDISLLEYLLLGSFVLLYLYYWMLQLRKARLLKTRLRYVLVKPMLRSIYFLLILVAALGPILGVEKQEVKIDGKDIFLLVDISQSMNATDIQPSRLEKAKFELKNFVDNIKSARIALVVFSSEAFLQCPLTHDHRILTDIFLKTLSTNVSYSGGTDFAPALKIVADKINKDERLGIEDNTGKIVILLSDGEDFGQETQEMVQKLEEKGTRIFTVGIGTAQGGKIPARSGFKKDSEGKEVITKLESNTLRQIARKANGRYFEINERINQMPQLIATVQEIKGELKESREIDLKANKYLYFLWSALFFVILDVLLTVRVMKL